jgi:hypothetical protein
VTLELLARKGLRVLLVQLRDNQEL